MRMTKEQLLVAARTAAKYLPAASADIMTELANRLDVTSVALSEALEQRKALAADNKYLLDLAARELSTSWLHNRAMLGMQAALLCLSQGDIKAAREWLEGTTDEAVAEMPDDMTPDGLQLWYDSYMRSSDGKNGFLTREESLQELSKRIPTTDAHIAALRAEVLNHARKEGAIFAANRILAAWDAGFVEDTPENAADIARAIITSTEFMDDAPEGDFDRSFADEMIKAISNLIRESKEEATSNGR